MSSGSSTMSTLFMKHNDIRHADLTGKKDVLTGLGHGAVRSRNHQYRAVHLGRTRDHVLYIVGMAWAVDMGIMTVIRLVLHVRRRYRDAALPLFRRLVDLIEA